MNNGEHGPAAGGQASADTTCPAADPSVDGGMARRAAGWCLVAALVFTPWAFGGTRPWSVAVTDGLLALAAAAWLIDCGVRRRRPAVSLPVLACVGLLTAQGWLMALNPVSAYVAGEQAFRPVRPTIADLPGSVDGPESVRVMRHLTAVLLALFLTCDLGHDPAWRRRLVWTVTLTGGALAAFGIVQKAGATDLFASRMRPHEGFPFASFNYHANAGAFLNLTLPAAFAALWAGVTHGSSPATRPGRTAAAAAGWRIGVPAACVVAILIAAAVNVSKAAALITAAEAVVLGAWAVRRSRRDPRLRRGGRAGKSTRMTAGVVAAGTVVVVVAVMVSGPLRDRWAEYVGRGEGAGSRRLLWGVCWGMAREAGPFGTGPGAFKLMLPGSEHMDPALYGKYIVTAHVPGGPVSMWSHAHQDYLQAVIEWGWVGASTWAALLLFTGVHVFRTARQNAGGEPDCHPGRPGPADWITVAMLGLLAHATVDFPLQVPVIQLYAATYLGLSWHRP